MIMKYTCVHTHTHTQSTATSGHLISKIIERQSELKDVSIAVHGSHAHKEQQDQKNSSKKQDGHIFSELGVGLMMSRAVKRTLAAAKNGGSHQ